MSLKLAASHTEKIALIVRQDSAIPEDLTDEVWEQYEQTLDESLLNLNGSPTRFMLRLALPYEATIAIQNSQMDVVDGKPKLNLGYMLEEVRYALVDIQNPPGVENPIVFSKDSDGYAAKQLIALLAQYGIVTQLFSMRQTHVQKKYHPTKK